MASRALDPRTYTEQTRRLREPTIEQLLKQHRIRRMDAETALGILKEPAIKVADGVAEAASIHLRSLIARLRVVNRELRKAEHKLDEICAVIGETGAASGVCLQRQDIMILRSCLVLAGSTSLHCSLKAPGLSAAVIIQPYGPCVVPRRLLGEAASRTSSSCGTPYISGYVIPSIIGRALPASTILSVVRVWCSTPTRPFARACYP